jgi:DNA-binding CsgD family transcriptional regulator
MRTEERDELREESDRRANALDRIPVRDRERLLSEFGLTEREKEFLCHALSDARDVKIAELMGITIHGAHAHRRTVFRKLGVTGMAATVAVLFLRYVGMQDEKYAAGQADARREDGNAGSRNGA